MHKYNDENYNIVPATGKFRQPVVYEEEVEPAVSLRVIAGDDLCPVRHVRLPCLIGRRDNGTKVMPAIDNLIFHSPFLSRKHAELVSIGGGGVAIRDTGSSNGTFLNGVTITPMKLVRLSEGDLIQFGTEDANQGTTQKILILSLDSVVICQFSTISVANHAQNNAITSYAKSSDKPIIKEAPKLGSSSMIGPMSKIADISRKLASLGIILNNSDSNDQMLNTRLNDTLETVEQLLESLEDTDNEKRKTYAEETIHTRPLIGTAMRIISAYEAIFCVLAACLLLGVIIFH